MDIRRLFLISAVFMLLLVIWQEWQQYQKQHAVGTAATEPAPAGPETRTSGGIPAAPTGPAAKSSDGTPAASSAPSAPGASAAAPAATAGQALPHGPRVEVLTDTLKVEIDTIGGDIRRVELRRYPLEVGHPEPVVPILHEDGEMLVAQSGLIAGRAEQAVPNHETPFAAAALHYELKPGENELTVPLTWTGPDGVRYAKTFVFTRDKYTIGVRFDVDNTGAEPWVGYTYGRFRRTEPPSKGGSFFSPRSLSYVGGAIYTPENKYQKIKFGDIRDGKLADGPQGLRADSGWVAELQHYFVSAWLPDSAYPLQFFSRAEPDGHYQLGFKSSKGLTVAPGAHGSLSMRLYAGPKDQARLKAAAEGLVLTVDYGWLTFIAAPLYWVLEAIHDLVRNWGWAIIALTVLLKLLFYPLSAASYKSMARMRAVQPRMQSLKEMYGDDRQKMNQALMELYREEKINPLGGCLPILVQIPVFIALYWVLLETVEMRQAPFIFWLNDLSSPDPYFVLPIIMGISMFLQQKLNPQAMDPLQQKIFMALPIVFTGMFLFFPSGLVLYWTVNNILSIAQQWRIYQVIGRPGH